MSHLTKSLFVAGSQCHKRLWWQSHEPRATELVPDEVGQLRMQLGTEVGQLAHALHPGGVTIPAAFASRGMRADATREAMQHASTIFEATFVAGRLTASVDILYRTADGWVLREVKSALDAKDEHVLDATFQRHVCEATGVPLVRIEILHLNREYRHPGPEPLFAVTDVTAKSDAIRSAVAGEIATQLAVLDGPLVDVAIGPHCDAPIACPFQERCWPEFPPYHVSTTYFAGKKWWEWADRGWHLVTDVPDSELRKAQAKRQKRAIAAGEMIVEPGLATALEAFARPIAFLDFETAMLAVPAWDGCAPLEQLPVQFSCHTEDGRGGVAHHAFLADGPGDCRRAMAEQLIMACNGAASVVAYYAQFEKKCLEQLAAAVPDLADGLNDIIARLIDPLPVVRDHLYHPAFDGSFSLKKVLPALVPALTYTNLEVAEGETASARLLKLLFRATPSDPVEVNSLRKALLAYCELDTWAMVQLMERLREISREA